VDIENSSSVFGEGISGVPEMHMSGVNFKISNGSWGNFLHYWNQYSK